MQIFTLFVEYFTIFTIICAIIMQIIECYNYLDKYYTNI